MQVSSGNSVYTLIASMHRGASATSPEQGAFEVPLSNKSASNRSDQELVAQFHERMAKQALDWADTDNDGRVSRPEYFHGQERLAELNNAQPDVATSERLWSALDPSGEGSLDAEEYREGLERLFPVKVGHFDQDYVERLRSRAPDFQIR